MLHIIYALHIYLFHMRREGCVSRGNYGIQIFNFFDMENANSTTVVRFVMTLRMEDLVMR